MAQNEIVKILKVQTGDSQRTVKGLKDEISALKDALLNTQQGTKQYDDIVKQLRQDQEDLTRVMNASKQDVEALEGSYNHLVKTMAELKKEWRATTSEARRNELGKEIDSINTKLKDMDASIGNYQRNVGNYAGGFSEAMKEVQSSTEVTRAKFESISKIATGLASGYAAIQGASALLGVENSKLQQTFVKLQAAIALAQGIGGMKDLVEGLGMAKVAFKGAATGCKTFIGSLRGIKGAIAATGIGILVVAIGTIIERFSTLNDEMDEAKSITKRLNDSIEASNKLLAQNQKAKEIQILETYRKAVEAAAGDVDKLTAAQQAYNEAIKNVKKETLTSNVQHWQKELENARLQLEVHKAVVEEMQKEINDRGYFDMNLDDNKFLVALGDFITGYEPIQEGVIRLTKEDIAALEEHINILEKALYDAENLKGDFEYDELLEYLNATVDTAVDTEKAKTSAAAEESKRRKAIADQEEKENKEKEDAKKLQIQATLDKIAEANRTEQEQELYELEQTYIKEQELLKGRNNDLLALTELYNKQKKEINDKYALEELQSKYDNAMSSIDSNQDYSEQETEVKYDGMETKDPVQAIQFEIDKLNELRELRIQFHNERLQQIDEMLSSELVSGQLEIELEREKGNLVRENALEEQKYINQTAKLEKEKEEEKKKIRQLQYSATLNVAKNTFESVSKLAKEGSTTQKALAVAGATIDTYQSAVGAYNAVVGIKPVGPFIAPIAAAAAVASGLANVKQILSVDAENGETSGPNGSGVSVTPSFNAEQAMPIDYTRNILTDAETSQLNQPQKVYVLESDITETQHKVEVTENNATF